jgi:hypothetical protein
MIFLFSLTVNQDCYPESLTQRCCARPRRNKVNLATRAVSVILSVSTHSAPNWQLLSEGSCLAIQEPFADAQVHRPITVKATQGDTWRRSTKCLDIAARDSSLVLCHFRAVGENTLRMTAYRMKVPNEILNQIYIVTPAILRPPTQSPPHSLSGPRARRTGAAPPNRPGSTWPAASQSYVHAQ